MSDILSKDHLTQFSIRSKVFGLYICVACPSEKFGSGVLGDLLRRSTVGARKNEGRMDKSRTQKSCTKKNNWLRSVPPSIRQIIHQLIDQPNRNQKRYTLLFVRTIHKISKVRAWKKFSLSLVVVGRLLAGRPSFPTYSSQTNIHWHFPPFFLCEIGQTTFKQAAIVHRLPSSCK